MFSWLEGGSFNHAALLCTVTWFTQSCSAAIQQLQKLLALYMGIIPASAGKQGTLQQQHLQPQRSPSIPGAGLADKVLPPRFIGHLDELVLVALSQHLLHGS